MIHMSIQNRISVTLSPRMKKALELAAGLEGSTTATYATQLLSQAIKNEVKEDPILFKKWIELEKEALKNQSWEKVVTPVTINPEDLLESQPNEKGWFLSGENPDGYLIGKDRVEMFEGVASGYIKSKQEKVTGFGTVMQQASINKYIGKQLDVSAVIKTDKVKDWAGLWVRIDDENMKYLWFDNMQSRPIKGTTSWTKYHTTFAVPDNSSMLNFGVLLAGPGNVWINQVTIKEVAGKKKTQVTDLDLYLAF